MVFKGGTSLSKVFDVIFRFSEDIDITIDYREMECGVTGPDESQSKEKNKKLAELMREDVKDYVVCELAPYFDEYQIWQCLQSITQLQCEEPTARLCILIVAANSVPVTP